MLPILKVGKPRVHATNYMQSVHNCTRANIYLSAFKLGTNNYVVQHCNKLRNLLLGT